MKRFLTLALLVFLLGCPRPSPHHAPDLDRAELPRPVLRIGTSGDYAPFSADGEGFDVDVARLLARDLDAEIEWVPFAWPELEQAVRQNRFDLAMSGVTWRPRRALVGWMSRAVASGGPCVIGVAEPSRVAVNRGGILERWARGRFAPERLQPVDDNRSLPGLLAAGTVDAIVTDSFELPHFRASGQPFACEPATDRKVYWIAPARAPLLGPVIDLFLAAREPELDALRLQHFGVSAPRDELDHTVDLLARRLAYMPSVAAWKRRRERPLEDPAREAMVLQHSVREAAHRGLDPRSARRLFRVQIELAKAVQRRAPEDVEPLDLAQVRDALDRLGERILASLARQAPLDEARLDASSLAPLAAWLAPDEVGELREALLELEPRGFARRAAGAAGDRVPSENPLEGR